MLGNRGGVIGTFILGFIGAAHASPESIIQEIQAQLTHPGRAPAQLSGEACRELSDTARRLAVLHQFDWCNRMFSDHFVHEHFQARIDALERGLGFTARPEQFFSAAERETRESIERIFAALPGMSPLRQALWAGSALVPVASAAVSLRQPGPRHPELAEASVGAGAAVWGLYHRRRPTNPRARALWIQMQGCVRQSYPEYLRGNLEDALHTLGGGTGQRSPHVINGDTDEYDHSLLRGCRTVVTQNQAWLASQARAPASVQRQAPRVSSAVLPPLAIGRAVNRQVEAVPQSTVSPSGVAASVAGATLVRNGVRTLVRTAAGPLGAVLVP